MHILIQRKVFFPFVVLYKQISSDMTSFLDYINEDNARLRIAALSCFNAVSNEKPVRLFTEF